MQTAQAWAKVNLALHVVGRRDDGYHLLDSAVAFGVAADRVTVEPGDGLVVDGPFAAGVPTDDSNLIRKALAAVSLRRAVTLEKGLPHPAGIGGGTSDAAAALKLVGQRLSTDALLKLGADLPVCMFGHAARMRGIGEDVTPLVLPDLPAVLVNPGLPVPTGQVFAALKSTSNPPMEDPPPAPEVPTSLDWLARQRNDLEAAALDVAPGIEMVLRAIRETGAAVTRMSGSGATCFGLYPDRAAAVAAAKALDYRGWWVREGVLR